jgi:hypothetical protein
MNIVDTTRKFCSLLTSFLKNLSVLSLLPLPCINRNLNECNYSNNLWIYRTEIRQRDLSSRPMRLSNLHISLFAKSSWRRDNTPLLKVKVENWWEGNGIWHPDSLTRISETRFKAFVFYLTHPTVQHLLQLQIELSASKISRYTCTVFKEKRQ